MTGPRRVLVLLLSGGLQAAGPRLHAQAGQSELAGEVRDASGARVAGAQVAVVDAATHRRVATATGGSGLFVLPNLRPDRYVLEVEAAGFQPYRRHGLELRTG